MIIPNLEIISELEKDWFVGCFHTEMVTDKVPHLFLSILKVTDSGKDLSNCSFHAYLSAGNLERS